MQLYYFDFLAPRRAVAFAKHINAPVEYVRVDFAKGQNKSPEYLALNPLGRVPTLVDGDLVLWEADAIMCHLARKLAPELWPQDERLIEIVRWMSWNNQHFNRWGGELYFQQIIKPRFRIGDPDPAAIAEAQKFWRNYAGLLDNHLKSREWLVGKDLSVADFAVAAALPWAEPAAVPIAEFPEIGRWYAQLEALPAWRDPYPN